MFYSDGENIVSYKIASENISFALFSKQTVLTILVWGSKESIYKVHAQPGLGFLEHIYIKDFDFEDAITSGTVTFEGEKTEYELEFLEFEGFTCVYTFLLN